MAHNDQSSRPVIDRGVKHVVLGNLLFQTWFHSIYPEELVGKDTDRLYVCRWCFRYSCDVDAYTGHIRVCELREGPPGFKVYEHGGYAVWEVDGEDHKLFAQNLSLFSKLFLDHKSVFFDVSSFFYYILTYTDPDDPTDYYVLGYFSKEKLSWDANNLACILVFPPYQHKQLGKILMGVSYKLSAWEWEGGFIGGPERPLSEMGRRSYMRFWEERVARYFLLGPPGGDPDEFLQQKQQATKTAKRQPVREQMTVQGIGLATGMLTEDVIIALKGMGVIEPDGANKKKRKTAASSYRNHNDNDHNGGVDVGDDDKDGKNNNACGEAVTVCKSNVLEWTQSHGVSLRDLVREEGFLGEWAPEHMQRQQREEKGVEEDSK